MKTREKKQKFTYKCAVGGPIILRINGSVFLSVKGQAVYGAEPFHNPVLVLPNTLGQIAGDACVQCAVWFELHQWISLA